MRYGNLPEVARADGTVTATRRAADAHPAEPSGARAEADEARHAREDEARHAREVEALADLAARYGDEALLKTIEGVHTAVAQRSFAAAGPGARPVRAVHDTVSRGVYGALRGGGAMLARKTAKVARSRIGTPSQGSLGDAGFGAGLLAAINGLIGDKLAAEGNELSFELELRADGRRVDVEREALRAAYPEATGKVAVFIHGLCESEEAWCRGTDPDERSASTYGARLRDELGLTPLYVRHNSGLRICENGRRLSWLLDELRREWPVPLQEIVLVGHSMGGLIARSACHEAGERERPWVEDVTHVISLGAPNAGSWLEQLVNVGGWSLGRLPESRPFSDFLNLRSVGIRDLRFGFIREDDWGERDPDDFHPRDETEPLMPVAGIEYHYVTATLSANPRHPVNAVFGDLLVRSSSASGPRLPEGTARAEFHELGGVNHFALLNHPRVFECIRGWLTPPAPGEAAA